MPNKFLENNFRKFRSSPLQSFKTGILKNFMILIGKHLCCSLFLIKLQVWRYAALLKKTLHHSFYPVNFAKFLRTAFCMVHLWWLLQKMVEFLRNSILIRRICTEEFIRNSSLCFNNLRKGFAQKNLYEILVSVWDLSETCINFL